MVYLTINLTNHQLYENDLKILSSGEEIEDEHLGIKYIIKRDSSMGHLCGYTFLDSVDIYAESTYRVHGGITFNSGNKIGFDTAHLHDWSYWVPSESASYKDTNFVRKELIKLIEQIVRRREHVIQ